MIADDEVVESNRSGAEAMTERAALLERALRGQGALLAEVQQAHSLLQSTFDALSDAIVVTDLAGRITQANGAVARLFGRLPEEVIGEDCHTLLAEGQVCPHTLTNEQERVAEHEMMNRARDRALNVRISSIMDAGRRVTGFVHVIRDITRQRVIERHLMQAERMALAGQMVSAVAHEVATPLSVVANIAEMLLLDVEPGSQTARELNKIITQARRIAEMMRGLLNFVRQSPAQYTAVDLTQLARETLDLMSYEMRRCRIEWMLEDGDGAPPVWADRGQLQQVLLNLLTNAMQAMKDGGRLVVRIGEIKGANRHPRAVTLTVEDSGPGIEPEAMEKLFDFFFTTRAGQGGTGLGLAITRQIVEGHGGTITAENLNGGGARFSVRLPVAFTQDQAASSQAIHQDKHA